MSIYNKTIKLNSKTCEILIHNPVEMETDNVYNSAIPMPE